MWGEGANARGCLRTTLVGSVDSKSRIAIFLAKISWKMRLTSRENIIASLASLTSKEKCDIL